MRPRVYAIAIVPVLLAHGTVWPAHSAQPVRPTRTIVTVVQAALGNGGPAMESALARPEDVAIAADGDVFVTDIGYHTIRSIDAQTGRITAVVGNGFSGKPPDLVTTPTEVPLGWPFGMVFDEHDDLIFADFTNQQVRLLNRGSTPVTRFGVTVPAGAMAVIAGDGYADENGLGRFSGDGGPATEASLNFPRGVALDAAGNLYFDDIDNLRVRRVDVRTGIITTVAGDGSVDLGRAGDGGPATDASVRYPTSVAFDADGELYIAEFSGTIRKVDHGGRIHTIAGTASFEDGFGGDGGPATDAVIGQNPKSLTFDPAGNLFFADTANDRVRRIDAETGAITTVAGPGLQTVFGVGAFSVDDVGVPAVEADLSTPSGLAFHDGALLVVSEEGSLLWRIDLGSDGLLDGDPDELAGPFIAGGAFKNPATLVLDAGGSVISSRNRAVLYRADPRGVVSPLAGTGVFPLSIDGPGGDPRDDLGDGGPASEAAISPWVTLALGPGNDVYLADWGSRRIRRIDATATKNGELPVVGPSSTIDTVVRNPFPSNTVALASGKVYFEDAFGHTIWRFDPTTGKRTRIAGTGKAGSSGDGGQALDARFRCVAAMTADRAGRHLFFADVCSGDVRVIDLRTGIIDTAIDTTRGSRFGYSEPAGLAVLGNRFLFVAEVFSGTVLRVDLLDRHAAVTRVAGLPYLDAPGFTGDDAPARHAELTRLEGLALDAAGKLFLTESDGQRVRRIGIVDIQPGVFPNRIDLAAEGTIPVAILGTPDVPASAIEPVRIRVAGAAPDPLGAVIEDVNGDGILDLVVQVQIQDMRLRPHDVEVRVIAKTYDGHRIRDADWVTPIGG
jgi:sugar lactone lactonase YvrE